MNHYSKGAALGLILAIATLMAANHVSARLAFDNGASVGMGVVLRSGGTALVMVALLALAGAGFRVPRATLGRAVVLGLIIAFQSFCLYSAVARIPVALALLAFQTFPLVYVMLAWGLAGERPPRVFFLAAPGALAGLALALDVVGQLDAVAAQWARVGAGIGFASAAAFVFGFVLYLTPRWLKDVDGRLRTLLTMTTTGLVMLALGSATATLTPPANATGWLGIALLTGFYCTGIVLLFTVLPRLGASSNSVAFGFEPIAGLVLAWAVLGQRIDALQMAGGALVIAAIMLVAAAGPGTSRR